jgi:SAM-dependent methyltransferase
MQNRETETYPEPESKMHAAITKDAISKIWERYLKKGLVLDVGCGTGIALEEFTRLKFHVVGITLNKVDLDLCNKKGFYVLKMRQEFLDFPSSSFDLVWCRHTLEHSPIPLLALAEFYRVLKPGKYMYLEMPAPGPCFHHELNKNHYAVFTQPVWAALISRSGFEIGCASTIKVETSDGIDEKIWFLCKKIEV